MLCFSFVFSSSGMQFSLDLYKVFAEQNIKKDLTVSCNEINYKS